MDKSLLFFLMMNSAMLGLSVYNMKFYHCKLRVDLVIISIYATSTFLFLAAMVIRACTCGRRCENSLLIFFLGLMFALAVEFVVGLIFTIHAQFSRPTCFESQYLMTVNWIVTGLGSLLVLFVVVASVIYFIATMRKAIQYKRMKKELNHLFEIIYDPSEKVDHLLKKYEDRLLTEPLGEHEVAVLADRFMATYSKDQGHLEEQHQETCIICLDYFKKQDQVLWYPFCEHAFHWVCLEPWLAQDKLFCPMCKQPLRICMVKAIRSNKKNLKQNRNSLNA